MKRLVLLLGLFVCCAVISFVGFQLPKNTIIVSGDFYQLPNYSDLHSRYQFAWFNQIGQGSYNPIFLAYPFYFILGILNLFFATHWIASWILFLFLIGSFLSFWVAVQWLIPDLDLTKKTFVSFLYAANSFVITIFSYGWGYTHHFLIYLFLPILISSYITILVKKNEYRKSWLYFIMSFTLSLPAYNNVAFFVLVLLIQFMVTLVLLLTRSITLNKALIAKLFGVFFIYLLITWPFMYPMIDSTINSSSKLFYSQAALGGENYLLGWINTTSSNFRNVFSLALDNYRYPFFETSYKLPFVIAGSIYFLFLLFLLFTSLKSLRKKNSQTSLTLTILISFAVFSFLSLRFTPPFIFLLKLIYLSPFFIFFRSPEKIFSAVPLFYTFLVAYLLHTIPLKKIRGILLIVSIAIILPFSTRILQQFLISDYNQFAKKSLPEYSYIISIPQVYYDAQNIINHNPNTTSVVSLPYSVKNSFNWSNYPMWHYVGHDVLHTLYNKQYISANTFDHTMFESTAVFKKLNEHITDSKQLLSAFQKFGGEYVFFHKDIDSTLLLKAEKTQAAISELEKGNILTQKNDNDFFTLYQLSREFVQPLISVDQGKLQFTRLSPTAYLLEMSTTDKKTLQFLQSFDQNWKLFILKKPLKSNCENVSNYANGVSECFIKPSFFQPAILQTVFKPALPAHHFVCQDYANCWHISPSDLDQSNGNSTIQVLLYYTHQNLIYAQLFIAVGILSISGVIILLFKIRTGNEKS